MIKIRSTEKKATSDINGLCDVLRQMLSYKEDLLKNTVTIVIKESLFQEEIKEIVDFEGNNEMVTERLIIEEKQPKAYVFKSAEIDGLFSAMGITISKTKGYTSQQNINKLNILLQETIKTERQTMSKWIEDTDHVIVNEFTKEEN